MEQQRPEHDGRHEPEQNDERRWPPPAPNERRDPPAGWHADEALSLQNEPDEGHLPVGIDVDADPSQREIDREEGPRVYMASLSDYNAGILHGAWLDAAVEDEELEAGVTAMLAASPTAVAEGLPAEEWAIHDYEGFGPLRLSEYEALAYITAAARGIAEHGQAFAAWAAHIGSEREDLSRFDDCYLGEWESVEDYAQEMLNDMGAEQVIASADSWLQAYLKLDVAGFARDLELGGDVTAIEKPDGGVWLYEGR